MLPYFIFKGIDSTPLLIIKKLPPIIKAEANIKQIIIPGRNGFLTEDDGTYQGITKSVECTISDLSQIDYICSWLNGGGDVVFSNQPDKIYKATIINQIEFKRVVATFHSLLIQFECQPHSYDINNNLITLTSSTTIFNFGSASSKPVIKVNGTGTIDLTINSNVIHLTNVVGYVTIDTDLMDAYKDTVLKNNDMSGDFPELVPGENTISWTGTVTSIEIIPNWRYL